MNETEAEMRAAARDAMDAMPASEIHWWFSQLVKRNWTFGEVTRLVEHDPDWLESWLG